MSRRKKEDDFEYKEKEFSEENEEQENNIVKNDNEDTEDDDIENEDELFRENFEVMYEVKNLFLEYVQEIGLPLCEKLNITSLLEFANEIGENFDK